MDPITGALYALTIGSDGVAGSVVRVDPDALVQISVHDKLTGGNGLIVNPDGTALYVATIASASQNARILSIDPTDPAGTQNIVSEGFNLSLIGGLRFFEASGGRAAPKPRPAIVVPRAALELDEPISGRREADVSAAPIMSELQAHLPLLISSPPVSTSGEDTGRIRHRTTDPTIAIDSLFADWHGAVIRHVLRETIH